MTFTKFNEQRLKMGLDPIQSKYSDNKLNSKQKFIFIWVQNFKMLNLDSIFTTLNSHCYKLKPESGRFMHDLANSIDIKKIAQNKGNNFIFSTMSFSDYNFKFVNDDISFFELTDEMFAFTYGKLEDAPTFDMFTGYFSNKSLNKIAEDCEPTKFELYRLVAEYTIDPLRVISL